MATELQKKKWPNMFKMFDVDGDGQIMSKGIEQFSYGMAQMRGIEPGSEEYQRLHGGLMGFWQEVEQVTGVGVGQPILMDHWLTFLTHVANSPELYQRIRPISHSIFGMLDQNGDGQVSINEYRKLCAVMQLGEGYADEIFAKLDLDANGTISMDELMQLSDQFFVGDDPDAPGNLFFGPI